MNILTLIIRNLWFYRKQYLAVMAGIVVSTAVLTGALIIGDSVRYSLQRITDVRLGTIKVALQTTDRFFRQELAREMAVKTKIAVAPGLVTRGIAINSEKNKRINQVQVTGINKDFCDFWQGNTSVPGPDEVVISQNVADKLSINQGDELLLRMDKIGKAPSGAPFVAEKNPAVAVRLRVSAIAAEELMGRFSLKNNQEAPYNVFVSLGKLASLLQLERYANLMVAAGSIPADSTIRSLENALKASWKPADAGLFFTLTNNNQYQLTTDRIFFDDSTAQIIKKTIPESQPILTYLVNAISKSGKSTPYSFVTAAEEPVLKEPLRNHQILVGSWLAEDLGLKKGDSVTLRYYLMGSMRTLREDSAGFVVKTVLPQKNWPGDRAMMPDFPGLTDAGNCRDWETGAPVDLKKIRDKDEQYWNDYRGTPKAFIAMESGTTMWSNRFGNVTAFRFQANSEELKVVEHKIMVLLNPARSELVFRPVYQKGILAAQNSTDFGELFLSLGFFIMVSAVLLTAMLFRLITTSRMKEAALMSALGFRPGFVMRMLAGEALAVSLVGSVVGALMGILYNKLIIIGLNTIWQEATNATRLAMHLSATSLLAGTLGGIVISMIILTMVFRKHQTKQPAILFTGVEDLRAAGPVKKRKRFSFLLFLILLTISLLISGWELFNGKTEGALLLLTAGGLLLPAGLFLFHALLIHPFKTGTEKKRNPFLSSLLFLSIRNLSLRRARTLSAIALLSIGTFSVIITGSFKKSTSTVGSRSSGTGWFLAWAETAIPLKEDLNTARTATSFGLRDEQVLQGVRYLQLPSHEGDNASCLNLNQVAQPAMLGVPARVFDSLDAFTFAGLAPGSNTSSPWQGLLQPLAPGVIPGYADQSVITWGLRKSVGDTLVYHDEAGNPLMVKLTGSLENSLFQGYILLSDSLLRLHYPSSGGSHIMLVDGPSIQEDTIISTLESIFRDYGMMATPARVKLATFNAVENTYLTVFMMLGGLGIIIGTVGLGIVLLRNLAQRRRELALCSAIGFQRKTIFRIIFTEHLLILLSGTLLGIVAAIPVVIPVALSPGTGLPWTLILSIILLTLANGFVWIYIPCRKILQENLVASLKSE